VITAAWWVAFTIPMLRDVEQTHYKPREDHAVSKALHGIGATLKKIWSDKTLRYFIIAYFFYIDGVHTIIKLSTSYGSDLGIDGTQLVLALLVTQFVAFPSAIAYGKLGRKFGTKTMLLVGIAGYTFITLFAAFFLRSAIEFWFLAIMVGLFQGGIQALSRSEFGKLCPKEHANEYFGLLRHLCKYAAIMGHVHRRHDDGAHRLWLAWRVLDRHPLRHRLHHDAQGAGSPRHAGRGIVRTHLRPSGRAAKPGPGSQLNCVPKLGRPNRD
jgi:UMF1 family MFS transporter